MSTIVTGTLKALSGANPPTLADSSGVERGRTAKAWVFWNGTGTPAITSSFNVSSLVDNGTGDYTFNFTNALADGNYCIAGTSCPLGSTTTAGEIGCYTTKTSSQCRIQTQVWSTTKILTDVDTNSVVWFR